MSDDDIGHTSFLGTGWSFPPAFGAGGVLMSQDETDIHQSLQILFGTTAGERFLQPKYGLDMHELLFEPMSTTLRTLLADRVRTALLVYEPRIKVLELAIDSPDPNAGTLNIRLEYLVRATNSRFNLVYPFYNNDGNEARGLVAGSGRG
ncbi:MAG: GPW/gp25 family protein [Gallionella sp.]|nr:GPW/gp25 family protein [Gallionella sp.]MDD4946096.1 GPW/gp25 family protein [Gallionella sp.]MDD5613377.1 GPW/gp25 family protein [Gallionella sp.]